MIDYQIGCECGWRGYDDELESKHVDYGAGIIKVCPKCKQIDGLFDIEKQEPNSES